MSPSTDSRENREFAAELKFLVSPALAGQIGGWVLGRLQPDPHAGGGTGGAYRITSLYFDSPPFDVFHRRGSYGRAKYRIRRYGASETVFLELKFRRQPPLLFKSLVEEFGLNSRPFSKYRLAVARLGLVNEPAHKPEPESALVYA